MILESRVFQDKYHVITHRPPTQPAETEMKLKKKVPRTVSNSTEKIHTSSHQPVNQLITPAVTMTTRKRNEFLDIPSSDDEEGSERGYDSEAAEETKGRSVKRRRVVAKTTTGFESDDQDGDFGGEEEEEDHDDEEEEGGVAINKNEMKNDDEDQQLSAQPEPQSPSTSTTSKTKDKNKTNKLLKPPKKNKTGVIYLSTLPPYLKPSALKSLLESRGFSPITKVFLTPAPPPTSSSGGSSKRRSNKRKTYTDGWVEFASKKTAKICAETLNASIVGGKKGGWYHDDVWNMKYLRGFKWGDLMEQVQRERSEREAKRRIEDARARKEEKVFLAGVEKGRVLDGIQRKREEQKSRKKLSRGDAEVDGDDEQQKVQVRRLFRQNEVKMGRKDNGGAGAGDGDGKVKLAEDTKRVLGKIF